MAAQISGARRKALLLALLEPLDRLRHFKIEGDVTSRLALSEEVKIPALGEVWNEFCRRQNVPAFHWMQTITRDENQVSLKRA